MSFFGTVIGAVRKFAPKKSGLADVKQGIEPPQIRLPSEDVLKSYESRYDESMPPKNPIEALREPQIPAARQNYPFPPAVPTYPAANQPAQRPAESGPKIDLILAEIEAVKAQLRVLGEKIDMLESHYRKPY
ncbi:MAG: hypothetical protein HY051_01740 [Candidatus Aenigmarchaeota archaeon]|nr:hypothetical protein [Candidatus Aenigmarchaeota archaeon]